MKLVEQAFNELFPEKDLENYNLNVKYTNKKPSENARSFIVKSILHPLCDGLTVPYVIGANPFLYPKIRNILKVLFDIDP